MWNWIKKIINKLFKKKNNSNVSVKELKKEYRRLSKNDLIRLIINIAVDNELLRNKLKKKNGGKIYEEK